MNEETLQKMGKLLEEKKQKSSEQHNERPANQSAGNQKGFKTTKKGRSLTK
jgi:altronate dehydratase